jgi:hypothetical protein
MAGRTIAGTRLVTENTEPIPSGLSCFSCALINARSILNKSLQLHHLNVAKELDILAITESWLCPDDTVPHHLLVPLAICLFAPTGRVVMVAEFCAFIKKMA